MGAMPVTDDRNDPRLRNIEPDSNMQEAYLVLSEEERAKGFVRPLRRAYQHVGGKACGAITNMGLALCETYARDPKFYGGTYCARCRDHFDVDEFTWVEDGKTVGS